MKTWAKNLLLKVGVESQPDFARENMLVRYTSYFREFEFLITDDSMYEYNGIVNGEPTSDHKYCVDLNKKVLKYIPKSESEMATMQSQAVENLLSNSVTYCMRIAYRSYDYSLDNYYADSNLFYKQLEKVLEKYSLAYEIKKQDNSFTYTILNKDIDSKEHRKLQELLTGYAKTEKVIPTKCMLDLLKGEEQCQQRLE